MYMCAHATILPLARPGVTQTAMRTHGSPQADRL